MKNKISALLLVAGLFAASGQQAIAQSYECEELLFPRQAPNRMFGYVNLMGEYKIDPVFVKAMPYEGRHAKIMKGNKYGLINCDGIMVVEPVYEELMSFDVNMGWARRGDLWELVDVKGKVLVPAAFQEVKDVPPYGLLSWVNKDGQWGLFSKERVSFIAKPQFDVVQVLSDSASIVRVENNFGLLSNVDGRFILPMELEEVKRIENNLIAFRQKGKWGAFISTGRVILKPEYDSLDLRNNYVLLKKGGLAGLADARGKIIVPVAYQQIGDFAEGYAPVTKDGKAGYLHISARTGIPFTYEESYPFLNGLAVVKNGGKYGVINRKNKFVLPAEYDQIERNYANKYFVAVKQGKSTLLDSSAAKVTSDTFEKVFAGDTAVAIRVSKDGKLHYFSLPEKHLLAGDYDHAEPLKNGFAVAAKQGKKGLITASGKEVIPFLYDSVTYDAIGLKNTFIVGRDGKLGVVDDQHQIALPVEFELIANTGMQMYKVKQNGRFGIIRSNGQWVVEPRYETMSNSVENAGTPEWPAIVSNKGKYYLLNMRGEELNKNATGQLKWLGEGLYTVEKKNQFGLMKANGEVLSELEFESALPYSSGLAAIKKDGQWGYINKIGRISIQPAFDEATEFNGNAAYVKSGAKWGAIDKRGRYLLKPEYDGYTEYADGTRRLYKN
jgi:hypothetical protein